jgi:hypothetical protein
MMDFHNESYVRVYTRNTTTWKRLGWDGQCLMMQLLRVVDMSGVLDLEGMTPVAAVVLHTDAPTDVAERGWKELIKHGVCEHRGDSILFPRFQEAQEANKSDRQRQREMRDRRRSDVAILPLHESQDVTDFEEDEYSSREIDPLGRNNYNLSQCSALPSSAMHGSALQGSAVPTDSSRSVTSGVVTAFRRPLPPAPPELAASTPPLWRVIIRLHAEAYSQKRPGLIPPRREDAAEKLAAWCQRFSKTYKTSPVELAGQVIAGLFNNERAAGKRWPLGFAASDPEEYLPPPAGSQVVCKPLASVRGGFNPGAISSRAEIERGAENNPDWLDEAAQ